MCSSTSSLTYHLSGGEDGGSGGTGDEPGGGGTPAGGGGSQGEAGAPPSPAGTATDADAARASAETPERSGPPAAGIVAIAAIGGLGVAGWITVRRRNASGG